MVKFFDYTDHNLQFSENGYHILLVKEFKDIWDKDETHDKKWAFRVFTYIYLNCDWQSPYSDYDNDYERHCDSAKDAGFDPDGKEINCTMVNSAVNKYMKILNSNRLLRLIKSINVGIDKYEVYFETVNFTEKIQHGASKGKLLHDPKTFVSMIKESNIVINKVKELTKTVQEELKQQEKNVRGNRETGYFEY